MKMHTTPAAAEPRRLAILFLTSSALAGGIATAQTNGTWNVNAPGNWSATGNWLGGKVASGATATADFSTLNITADHLITIDAPYMIGTLISQDATTSSNSWTFGGAGPLTLDNGGSQPLLDIINRFPVIAAPLAGTNGFAKTGAGQLTLSGNNAGLSGTINLADVTGTNGAGLVLADTTAIGGVTTVNVNGTGTTSGQFLALSGGVTLGSDVTINLNSQGGNSAPPGGLRSTGTATDVNTIAGPVNITLTNARIANNSAGRLDITGPITAGGGVTSFLFRFGANEGIHLTNPANSWSGTTIHSQDTLWFEPNALPATTNLQLCASGAGTVQTNGSFTRALGTAANEVQFALNATRAQGFGARGGPLALNFGGSGADILFDTTPTTAPATRIRTSTLVLNGATADSDLTLVNPLDLNGADRTIQVSAMSATLQGGVKGGAFSLTKTGTGTLNLTGACTYTGGTTLAGGTLQTSGANDRLPTTTTLAFTGTSGTLDLTTTSQTLAGLTVPNLLAASYTISGAGLTLNGAANREFGPGGAVTNAHSITMDLSGLSSFTSTAPANVFRVGHKAGTTNSTPIPTNATVTLAQTNSITAATLAIADVGSNSDGGGGILRLGTTNTINANTINVGSSSRSDSWLEFAAGLTNPTATVRDTAGTGRVTNWLVGRVNTFWNSSANSTTFADTVDFSAGSLDALVNNLEIGVGESRHGVETATFLMGKGTLDATTISIGRIFGSPAAGNDTNAILAVSGTFTLNDATGLVKADTITLATNTITAGLPTVKTVSGTFNLTSGTLEASTIQRGAQTGTAGATTAFNWTDGTLRNLTPAGLTIDTVSLNLLTGTHVFDATGAATITVNPASTLAGSGGVTKTGSGTVTLAGANSYTGPTDVQAGTLAISNSFPNGSAFTVDPAATLALDGVTLEGSPALAIDGNLSLTGPVRLILPTATSVPVTISGVLQYGSISGAANLTTDYRNASITVGATSANLNVLTGLALTWTGGASDLWDINSSVNWTDGIATPRTFFWADSVTFDEAGALARPSVVMSGELRPAALVVNSSTDYTFGGSGQLSGSFTLTKNGTSTLTLGGTHSFTGGITVNAGTLKPGGNQSLGANGQVITIKPGGALDTNGAMNADRDYAAVISGSGIGGTGAIINSVADHQNGFGSITLAADATIGGDFLWNLRPITPGTATLDLAGFTLTKTGPNNIGLADGVMTSDGSVNIDQGTLAFARLDVSGTGSVNTNSGATLQFINYTSGVFTKAITVNDGTVTLTGSANFALDAPVTLSGAASNTFDVASGRVLTLTQAVGGTGGLVKAGGTGTMVLLGDNTYAGPTLVSAGALQFGSRGSTGLPGPGAITTDASLRFARADTVTIPNDIDGTGNVFIGVNVAVTAPEYDALTTLTGNNSFSGNITVYSGGLRILDETALGTGPKTIVLTNGTNGRPQFYLDGSGGNITVPAEVGFDTSSPDPSHPAIGNLAGDNVIEGTITLKSGGGDTAVKVIGGTLALNGQISAANTGRNVRLAGTAGTSGTINGKLTNGTSPWGLLMLGPNTWTLTNSASDFTGPTTVSGGTLLVNGTLNLATGNVTVASGATLGGDGTIGGNTTVNAGAILAPGTSVGTLTTVNSVVLNGTLAIEINGISADQLNVGGTLDISNATIEFDELAAASGAPIIIASYGALTGIQFANMVGLPTGYAVDYNYNSLKQIALVSVAGDYNAWAAGYGLNPLTDGAATFDKDNDGLTNAQEYAFGLDPTSGSSVSPVSLPLSKPGGIFKYTRRPASLTGLTYRYESSTSLSGGWTPFTPVAAASNGGSPVEEITVTVPAALLANSRLFVRVAAD